MALLWNSRRPRRRQSLIFRIIILAFVIALCYQSAVAWIEHAEPRESTAQPESRAEVGERTVHSPRDSSFADEIVTKEKLLTASDDIETPHDAQSSPSIPQQHIEVEPQQPIEVQPEYVGSPRNGFKEALQHVLSLSPSDLQTRELLRPIAATGEENLLELGLRTRAFKQLFEAWEALHLVPSGDSMVVQDDVIQYLRAHPEMVDDFSMDLAQIIHSYETYRYVLTRLSTLLFPWTAPYFADHIALHAQMYNGKRGIVFSAGDNQAPFLLTSIPSIRQLGCDLPIEIIYLGDDDLGEDFQEELEKLPGVVTRDMSRMVDDRGWALAGWAGKPFAILLSSFREVIFIDADSLFFRNPEVLFQDPVYEKTSALFFKDRLMMPELKKSWLRKVLPKPISRQVIQSRFWTGESGHMQESGVVVVDKWKHFIPMLLVARMNGPDRDGNRALGKVGVYDMVYGDKETFWLGWELAGDTKYGFHGGDAGIMGRLKNTTAVPKEAAHKKYGQVENNRPNPESLSKPAPKNVTICAPQLLHLDVNGRPLWFNGWLVPNKFSKAKDTDLSYFEAFIKESREAFQEPAAWQLGENNICCLTSDKAFEFTQAEKDILQMIIDNGRRVGALNKVKS